MRPAIGIVDRRREIEPLAFAHRRVPFLPKTAFALPVGHLASRVRSPRRDSSRTRNERGGCAPHADFGASNLLRRRIISDIDRTGAETQSRTVFGRAKDNIW